MLSDLDRVLALLADVVQLPVSEIRPEGELEDIGCDALCKVEIAFQIEDEFGVPVAGEAAWRTPADIVRAVEAGRVACEDNG